MEKIKIAINGFGRIGRNVFKIMQTHQEFEIIGINDIAEPKTLAHLLKYDSTQGRYQGQIEHTKKSIIVDGKEVVVTAERSPAKIPWAQTPDLVIESTGLFRTRESEKGGYGDHLKNGAKKVLLTVPAKDEVDRMIVLGVNDADLKDTDLCVSNASCTTNCITPVVKVLHDNFTVLNGFLNTIHSYTNDQHILDAPHSDLRRARSAAVSQIPTTTGAAVAVTKIIPDLKGLLDGMAIRVPTPTGSSVYFVCNVEKTPTVEEINRLMKEAANTTMKGILEYSEDPLVSVDIIHNPHSSIFDAENTKVIGNTIKILTWYDNEWGYSNRVVDLAAKMMK
jgi:glyceraldehyde 3-phosphate dehydrogenase